MKKQSITYHLLIICLILLIEACDKNVSHSPVAPAPSEGKIIINSTPKGFTIYNNGKNTGKFTTDSLIFLDPGEYKITLKRIYWKDTTVAVNVAEGSPVSININYLPNVSMYGKLVLYSEPPGAKILINDSLSNNVTPDTLENFLPGKYDITFQLANHRQAKFDAIVESGKVKSYSAALKDTSIWLDFRMSNSGIQSNKLSSINIDQNGIKWIGSFDKGIISFDDRTFTNYNMSNSAIPDNQINCVSVDAKNQIWVGTPSGIGVFNGVNWNVYNRYNSGLTSQIVNSIRFDDNSNVWIGTTNNLTKYDGTSWIKYDYNIGHDYINDMYIESLNKLWLATNSTGIFTFENEKFLPFNKPKHNYPSLAVSSVASDNFGNIWFCFLPDSADAGGIGYWDGTLFTTLFSATKSDYVNDIFIDSKNNKWISASIGYIWYDENNASKIFTTFNSLISSDNTTASVRDNNGALWITTYGGGLNKLKP